MTRRSLRTAGAWVLALAALAPVVLAAQLVPQASFQALAVLATALRASQAVERQVRRVTVVQLRRLRALAVLAAAGR